METISFELNGKHWTHWPEKQFYRRLTGQVSQIFHGFVIKKVTARMVTAAPAWWKLRVNVSSLLPVAAIRNRE